MNVGFALLISSLATSLFSKTVRRQPLAVIGMTLLILFVGMALLAPLLAPYSLGGDWI